jgi:hypothetical protein
LRGTEEELPFRPFLSVEIVPSNLYVRGNGFFRRSAIRLSEEEPREERFQNRTHFACPCRGRYPQPGTGECPVNQDNAGPEESDGRKAKTAANVIGTFINQVEVFMNTGILTGAEGYYLIDMAEASLFCTG